MQKKKNDVKARTTLLLSLPDEHQLRFSKHKTTKELWAAILKTFGGNEATKKTKKNLLKQQYGNFRAEGSEMLEQTFTRLQVIVGQLQFMGVEVEQDDLNQKFLTSLAPEWLMHTIVWRNMSDLNTMSLDDLYNHLKVYEAEVQKKSKPNTQNIAFISSTKHSRGNDEVNTASVYTASSNVPTASANVATISSGRIQGRRLVFNDQMWQGLINQKLNALNVRRWAISQKNAKLPETRREEGETPIDREDHALVAEAPTEFALMANIGTENKEVVDGKLAGLLSASKDLDNLIESQRIDKSKEGLGYTVVPLPVAQLYLSPKKDLSWTGLQECADDTVTDYSRPSPTVESKFEAKGDEGYFLGYLMSSKAFRVFNKSTKRVEEKVHIEFLENKAIEKGFGPNWLFDIDSLTKSMNYVPVVDAGTHSTNFAGTKVDASKDVKKDVSSLRYIVLPNWVHEEHLESTLSQPQDTRNTDAPESSGNSNPTATSTNPPADQLETLIVETLIPTFENILGVASNSEESNGVEADVSNMEITITASPTLTLKIHRDHPKSQIIGPVDTPIQTRNKSKEVGEQKPKKISDALQDPSWVEAMQEKLLQFKIQKVWSLVDCLKGVRPIGIKWVLKNKKDERWIVIRNKSRLVAQGHTQDEGIDYDEVFAPVTRIEAIKLFLAYALFMGFTVYQMDVKSAFLYGTIDEEVYVMQPPGFLDPEYPARVYKVEKAMYGLHQAPRA
nr:hypothetical protein [Tanacetum cinerariifolium]